MKTREYFDPELFESKALEYAEDFLSENSRREDFEEESESEKIQEYLKLCKEALGQKRRDKIGGTK